MNVRTYVKRAYEADALSRDQLRNESNAFHHLIGQISYLAVVKGFLKLRFDNNTFSNLIYRRF